MCQFPLFETILIENGKAKNLVYHQKRVDYAFAYFFQKPTACNLSEILIIPEKYQTGKIRCRVDYNECAHKIIFAEYQSPTISAFELVYLQNSDYRFKYSDRTLFENLSPNQIIVNNGFISDTPIANLLFYRNEQWFSPEHYLLKGTQLSRLIDEGRIQLAPIRPEDLCHYEKMMWINAMNPFDEQRATAINILPSTP